MCVCVVVVDGSGGGGGVFHLWWPSAENITFESGVNDQVELMIAFWFACVSVCLFFIFIFLLLIFKKKSKSVN